MQVNWQFQYRSRRSVINIRIDHRSSAAPSPSQAVSYFAILNERSRERRGGAEFDYSSLNKSAACAADWVRSRLLSSALSGVSSQSDAREFRGCVSGRRWQAR